MSGEMNTEEQDTTIHHEQQDTSFFSDLATAISGAKQTANQEFGRFWGKFVSGKPSPTHIKHSTLSRHKPTQNDISRMKARKNIQGRIIPDNKGYMKDAEIQTDADAIPVTRRKRSPDEETLHRPAKMSRSDLTPFSASNHSPPEPPRFSSQPINDVVYIFDDNETPKALNRKPLVTRPIRSPLIRKSIVGSVTPVRASPERPDIVTGSSKSVKRLTFELEEALSPRFPISSPVKKNTTKFINDDPFDSKPLKDLPKTVPRWTQEEEEERIAELKKKINNMQSQINDEMSSPSSIKSPTPSHTVAKEPYGAASSSSSLMTRNATALNRIPVPPPLPPVSFSPVRDIQMSYRDSPSKISPNRDISLAMKSSPIRKMTSPIQHIASPIRNISSPLKKSAPPNKSISSPYSNFKKRTPTEKHKLKMRELIQAIPFYQLKKADKIIGADGIERPNPFWNEIYGRRSR